MSQYHQVFPMSPQSVVLIPYILQTVGSWGRPGGIGTLFLILSHTFRYIIKCSLLKLLCALACLCKGTPLQPLILDFFGIDFHLHPHSQFPFFTFRGKDNITRGKTCRYHERYPIPNLTTPAKSPPTPPTNYTPPRQAPHARRAILRCHALLEEYLPCVSRNILSVQSPCSSFAIDENRPGHPTP